VLDRCLGGEEEAQHVDVKLPMKMVFGDGFERSEFVNARVVDEDIEASISRDRRIDDALRPGRFGHVARHGNGLAACGDDLGDDGVGAGLARCIIDDDGRARGMIIS